MIRRLLDTDRSVRRFFEGETTDVPEYYIERVKKDLGPFWEYLPAGALNHDPQAYLKKVRAQATPRRHDGRRSADSVSLPMSGPR